MNHSRSKRFMTAAIAAVLVAGLPVSALGAASEGVIIRTESAAPSPMPAPMPPTPAKELPEPKITKEQALDALREFFTVPEKGPSFDYQFQLVREWDRLIWRIEASYREANMATSFTLGMVDAMTGRVLSYNLAQMLPEPIRTGPLKGVKSRDDAKARAEALLQKMVPDRFATLQEGGPWTMGYYGSENESDVYYFVWIEYVDGIPFPSSTVGIGVHKQTLEYVSLQVSLMDGLKFQPGPAKVTAADALERYRHDVTPNLAYQNMIVSYPYGYSRVSEVKLVYSLENLWRSVDAMTGEWAKEPTYFRPPTDPAKTPPAPEPVPAGNVTPVKAASLPLSENEARNLAAVILDRPAVDLRSEQDMYSEEKGYRFAFYDQNGGANIHLDQKTGLLRNAWRYSNVYDKPMMPGGESPEGKPETPAVTPEVEEQAKQVAMAVVQTYYSDVRDQMWLTYDPYMMEYSDQQFRYFRFTRKVNGLDLPNDGIHVSVELTTMQWRDISANLTLGVTFPDPAGAISPEQALDAVLTGREPILIYRPVYPQMEGAAPFYGPMPRPTEADLVYVLRPTTTYTGNVDAITGELVTWDAFSQPALAEAYTKVAGHWAEGEFQHFLRQRTILPEQLNPEGALSRSLAVMLLLVRNTRYDYGPYPRNSAQMPFTDVEDHAAYGAVRFAWSQGWLKPAGSTSAFRPDEAVTRAEFAVWAARSLGLGALARSEALKVADAFTDLGSLTTEQRNAVNFLAALGLLGAAETFRGNDAMTQAEGVALSARIYNYLLTDN